MEAARTCTAERSSNMRTLPIVLAAAGAISLLAAAAPAKADWDDHGRSGWRDRDWRTEEWRGHTKTSGARHPPLRRGALTRTARVSPPPRPPPPPARPPPPPT